VCAARFDALIGDGSHSQAGECAQSTPAATHLLYDRKATSDRDARSQTQRRRRWRRPPSGERQAPVDGTESTKSVHTEAAVPTNDVRVLRGNYRIVVPNI